MKRFELSLKIINEKYVDSLVIALARQGYSPYIVQRDYGIDIDKVCIEV